MKLQSITLLCLLLPTALTYGMIVPISGNIDEASNSLYYDSNPRQFVWLLPQMYAGMSADTAFQISLSVTVCTPLLTECIRNSIRTYISQIYRQTLR
jgi:hypothetical protein